MTIYVSQKNLKRSHQNSHTLTYHTNQDCHLIRNHNPETRNDQWRYRINADTQECKWCAGEVKNTIDHGERRCVPEGSHLESLLNAAQGDD